MQTRLLRYALVAMTLVGPSQAVVGRTELAPESAPLQIKGSSTLFPVAQAWVAVFRERHPDLQITLEAVGTTAGLAALLAGHADLALASRPSRAEEEALALERGFRLERIEVVRDALSVIVNHANPVASLTREQIRGLFTGDVGIWDELGGPPRPVTVVVRKPESHTGQFFSEQFLGSRPFADSSVVTSDREEMVARVAEDVWAVGFTGLADVLNSEKRELVTLVKLVLDSRTGEPGNESGEHSTYAVSRPLFFYARSPRSPAVDRFVEFVRSPEGQALIVESNFFPIDAADFPPER